MPVRKVAAPAMPMTVPRKIARGVLIGSIGLLCFGLIVFFAAVFFGHGKAGHMKAGDAARPMGSVMMNRPGGMDMVMESDGGMMGRDSKMMVDRGEMDMFAASPAVPMPAPGMALPMEGMEQKVMKNGTLSIQVESADRTLEMIKGIAAEKGGLVHQSNFNQDAQTLKKSGSVTVRVPVDRFDETLTALKQAALVVLNENVSGTDVTSEYIDLNARLSNKRAEEAALQALLDRAEEVADVIEVTGELADVRAEIESMEGQMRYMDGQTQMATISVYVTEDSRIGGDPTFRPGQTFSEAVMELLRTLGAMAKGLILFAVLAVPLFILFGVVFWGLYRVVKKCVKRFF